MLRTPMICHVIDERKKLAKHEMAETFVANVLKADTRLISFLALTGGIFNFTNTSEVIAIGMANRSRALLQSPMYAMMGEPKTVFMGGTAKMMENIFALFFCE